MGISVCRQKKFGGVLDPIFESNIYIAKRGVKLAVLFTICSNEQFAGNAFISMLFSLLYLVQFKYVYHLYSYKILVIFLQFAFSHYSSVYMSYVFSQSEVDGESVKSSFCQRQARDFSIWSPKMQLFCTLFSLFSCINRSCC